MEINGQIKQFIKDNYLFDDSIKLEESTDFFEKGIIDSTGIVELVSFIEETFEIDVKDQELIPENFSTLGNIYNYLSNKKNIGANLVRN